MDKITNWLDMDNSHNKIGVSITKIFNTIKRLCMRNVAQEEYSSNSSFYHLSIN